MARARLTGTRRTPALLLTFPARDTLPRQAKLPKAKRWDLPPTSRPPTMLDWVRRIPGRRWSPEESAWVATSVGPDPDQVLADAGFEVDLGNGPKVGITSLAQLYDPIVDLATQVPANVGMPDGLKDTQAVVFPRLTGYEALLDRVPAAGKWLTEPGCWVVELADLHSTTLPITDELRTRAVELHAARTASRVEDSERRKAAVLAQAKDIADVADVAAQLKNHGKVPDWFGFNLFGYQHAGALAVATSHSFLCDEPGLGKTAQAIAAAALRGTTRLVVACPPVVSTNWQRELEVTGLVTHMTEWLPGTPAGHGPDLAVLAPPGPDPQIARFVSGRKEPELPQVGAVIVSDAMLVSRPKLLARLIEWAPDGLFYDEAHRAQTYESSRATAVRTLAEAVGDGLRVAITGTPMSTGPHNLAGPLAVTGHLDTVFGGHSAFLETYCVRDRFGGWKPNKGRLTQLRQVLEDHVWTRRTKAAVLPDLPKKLRSATYLDVDLSGFRAAHAEVVDRIRQWVEDFTESNRRPPTVPDLSDPEAVPGKGDSEVEKWAREQVGLVSLLRRAAGVAKVDAATALIREHVEGTTEHGPGGPVYTRPLIVWVHHKDVGVEMMRAVPEAVARTEVIRGGTSADERGRIVDDFQAGKVPVLVASIAAAGVGITLTRSCDMVFVETDWTVANLTQAEDRSCRIGQTRPVNVTTLIAPGTLDPRIQEVLKGKTEMLDEVLAGGDNDPAVMGLDDDTVTMPAGILTELAVGVIEQATKGRRRRSAAAA